MRRLRLTTPIALAVSLASPAHAQLRLSEAATTSQTVDGTRITIEYSRPRARGRTPEQIFGKEVPWDTIWTPGANMATTLELSRGVSINGRAVPRGRYSVWSVPHRDGDWTIILDPGARRYHGHLPDSSAEQIRLPAHVSVAPFTEVLAWSFPRLTLDSATIAMQWMTTRLDLDLKVEPSMSGVFTEREAAPYVGEWLVSCKAEFWELCRKAGAPPARLSITRELGHLVVRFRDATGAPQPFVLVRIEPGKFVYGGCCPDHEGDLVAEVREWLEIDFQLSGLRATSFEAHDYRKSLATATRAR